MMASYAEIQAALQSRIDALTEAGMQDFLNRVNAMVDEILGAAEAGAGDFVDDPDAVLPIIINAMDQVIDRGNTEIADVFTDYAENIGYEIHAIAPQLGLSVEQISVIINRNVNAAAMNNYQIIRQIIPPIRRDVLNVFTTAARNGHGISQIEEALREIGLPWSPTGRYSPGERAAMIANAEFNRIRQDINADWGQAAGVKHVENIINRSLSTHSDQCVAATAAGQITEDEMKRVYGLPPRHPRCGCHLLYGKPKWYDPALTRSQIAKLKKGGTDVEAAIARWNEKGPQALQDDAARKSRLQWENGVMNNLFGG